MHIGRAIKSLRQQRNMKQYELAKKADISTAYLSQIENGQHPSHDLVERIAVALQVSSGFLYFKGLDRWDFAKNKQMLFDSLYPTLHNILLQLV